MAAAALPSPSLRLLVLCLLAQLAACTNWRMYDEPEASYTQARRLPQPRWQQPAPSPPWFERAYANTLYVDQGIGNDANDGLTHAQALASITRAVSIASSDTVIYVGNGTYTNNNYGRGPGFKNNAGAVSIRNFAYLKLTNLEGHSPKIAFDGSSGVSCVGVDHFQITGFEIEGPNKMITHEQATEDRLVQSNRYTGRGIVVWSGDHVRIANNVVHHCANSGIRAEDGDYVTIEDNRVYNVRRSQHLWTLAPAIPNVCLAPCGRIPGGRATPRVRSCLPRGCTPTRTTSSRW